MDSSKPVVEYARRWPRKTTWVDDVVRGVGILLTCIAQLMLTLGIFKLAMVFDEKLDGVHIAGEEFRDPSILVIIGIVTVLAAFRLIQVSTPRAE